MNSMAQATKDEADVTPRPAPVEAVQSSVSKALQILSVLVDNPKGEVSLSDLSAEVGLPLSTVHRLLNELCQHGLAGRVGVKYCPGFKLVELRTSSQMTEHRTLLTVATPVLEWLFAQSGATVQLGVLRGFDVVCLEKFSGSGGSRIPSRVGARLPASCSAMGKALLASHGFAELLENRGTRKPLPALTQFSIRDPRILAQQLRSMSTSGVMLDDGESYIGVRSIAAPVVPRNRVPAASISISVFGSGAPLERFTPLVLQAARRIADGLA
jgi:IclR family transcriptional regulator, acetate operon repressor